MSKLNKNTIAFVLQLRLAGMAQSAQKASIRRRALALTRMKYSQPEYGLEQAAHLTHELVDGNRVDVEIEIRGHKESPDILQKKDFSAKARHAQNTTVGIPWMAPRKITCASCEPAGNRCDAARDWLVHKAARLALCPAYPSQAALGKRVFFNNLCLCCAF